MLLLTSITLVIVTLVKGYEIEENPFFIIVEVFINAMIFIDFAFRLKLLGFKRYF